MTKDYVITYVEAQNAAFMERDPEKRRVLIERWAAMPRPPAVCIGWGE